MLDTSPDRLMHEIRRLGAVGCTEAADTDLLTRFVISRDETAFEQLMQRHGDMVYRTCRRHLGHADAEDAFQAVFLVLARDAGRIGRREAVAGWLYRVAYFVSRKLMGRLARRSALPVREEDRIVPPDEHDPERWRVIDEEINALPEKQRSAVVLCWVEGWSNTEAAAALGCPRGTVDSRLAAARKRLQVRLVQRGFGLGAGAAVLGIAPSSIQSAPISLRQRTLEAVIQFARTGSAAGAVAGQVLSLVAGVANTMISHRMPLLAAAVLMTFLGGMSFTIYHANAQGKKPDKPAAEKPKPADRPAEDKALKTAKTPATTEDVQALLRKPSGINDPIDNVQLREFLDLLSQKFDVPIRLDLAAFNRMEFQDPVQMYEQQIRLPVVRGLTLEDALREALAQLSTAADGSQRGKVTYRIRDQQIIVMPAYVPQYPSVGGPPPSPTDPMGNLSTAVMLEQEEGDPVSLSVEEKPLLEVLQDLRRSTGANIVLDVREKEKAKQAMTATLHDVRLMAALRVLGDMCDLQPVAMNNVFYVTSKQNAERLQKEIDRRRHGDPAQFSGLGGFGLGGLGSPPPAPKPEDAKPEGKKE